MNSPDTIQSRPYPGNHETADSIVSAWNPAQLGDQSQSQQQTQDATQSRIQALPRRVCMACRRRKVGCDKKQPCHNCKKFGAECVYPSDSASAGRQILTDSQLWEQLHRLEPMFKTLADCVQQGSFLPFSSIPSSSTTARDTNLSTDVSSAQAQEQRPGTVAEHPSPAPPTPPYSVGSTGAVHREQEVPATTLSAPNNANVLTGQSPPREAESLASTSSNTHASRMNGDKVEAESNLSWSPYGVSTGKLVKDDGRDRYVSGTFWEALHTEDDMSDGIMSEEESDYEDTRAALAPNISQYSFIFSTSTRETESPSSHPPQHHRLKAWNLFKSNIHPVATVLHIPSVEQMVLGAIQNPKDLAPNVEALMFVIYFGAVNSLPEDDTPLQFGEKQSVLLARFRRDADAAFTRSRLMETDDMLTLQTFVIYLILLRCRDPTYSWTMTGLAVRLSQSLGMHRDGSTLNLPPFEAEMRRRLWWNLCVLDTPASEDYSCSSGLLELSSFNSRRPMNVNDSAWYPGMTEYPREQDGITDMSFTAARCWASNLWRTMIDTRHLDPDTGLSFAAMTTADKEAWVEKQRKIIYALFPEDPTSREPLYCLTMSFIGTIIANLRIMVLNPLGTGVSLTEEQKRHVFQGAMECMVHSYKLRTDPLLANWSWLTKCYNEWHAFAIILSELCNQPLSRDADKAWRVVEQSAVLRWDSSTKHSRVHQWRSVMKTIEIARRRRKNGMRRRKSSSLSAKHSNPAAYRGGDSTIGGPTRAGGFSTRQNSIYTQGNQAPLETFSNTGPHLQEFQSAMSQADQMMRQLEEADDMCDFTSEDGRLYFAES
ncbi:hypothetical protein CGLO_17398 [Colletotrichum gloeosporioides Cg-14]|uniref:Zn(2)-C6 fungal-type domain-containing protein n=1 Tax=Colletotrichum gloeosporioides (strain Cg-14) TaxID=1237896 RepID=T0JWR6_COLGC|nr:hypothetical protein CGLO_17398 [Colletotrichum gloeosporioides Cg-14]